MTGFKSFEIRDYAITDKADCLTLFDSNVPHFFDNSERDMFEQFLDHPGGVYFVIEKDQLLCGCGGYASEDRGQARFTWGMVDNSLHGQGLGKLLAEYRLDSIMASDSFQEVELFTTPVVAPFFKKFGFQTEKVEKDGFAPGMDKVQMLKRLSETP